MPLIEISDPVTTTGTDTPEIRDARRNKPAEAVRATGPDTPASPRTRARLVRRGAFALLAIAVLVLVARAIRPTPIQVEAAAVRRGPLTVSVTEDGLTRIRERYLVSAPIPGLLRRIQWKAGDRVRRGAILGYILPLTPSLLDARTKAEAQASYASALAGVTEAEAAVTSARAASSAAQREASRLWALLEGGAVSVQATEQAVATAQMRVADLLRAEAAVEAARGEAERRGALLGIESESGNGDLLEVRAPVTGSILKVLVESEGVVQSGMPLMEIGNTVDLEVVIDVLSNEAVAIQRGAEVVVDRWGGSQPLHGRVVRVEPLAATRVSSLGVEEQRVNVIASLDLTGHSGQLGDNYQVEARIVTWQVPSALLVASGSLFRHAEGWAVYSVVDGHARQVPVTIGRSDGKWVEVLDGVNEGDLVIAYPGDNLSDGSLVRTD